MNTLKYFKDLDNNDLNRSDRFEAITSNIKLEKIQLGDFVYPVSSGTIISTSNNYNYCNVFCMYLLGTSNNDEVLFIDKRNKEFGKFCVYIYDINSFLERIVKKIEELSIVCHYQKITYIEKNKEYSQIDNNQIVFTKFNEFDYQKEFRIIIDTKMVENKPYELVIGDLNDIATPTSIDNINKILSLHYKKLKSIEENEVFIEKT